MTQSLLILPFLCRMLAMLASGQNGPLFSDAELLRLSVISPAAIEVVLKRSEDGARLACAYDMGSGAWYRYQDGVATAYLPGIGAVRGPAIRGGLASVPDGRNSDYFIERRVFPFLYSKQILDHPDVVTTASPLTDETPARVEISAPWGDPRLTAGSGPLFGVYLTIDKAGRVIGLGRTDVADDEPLTVVGEIGRGIPVTMPTSTGAWEIIDSRVGPAGTRDRPKWTVAEIESRTNEVRVLESTEKQERAMAASSSQPSVEPGTAKISQVVQRSTLSVYMRALVIAGIALLVVGVVVWRYFRR